MTEPAGGKMEVVQCPTCNGENRMPRVFSLDFLGRGEGGRTPTRTRKCPTCNGRGRVQVEQDWCRGIGRRKFMATPLLGSSGLRVCLVPAPQSDDAVEQKADAHDGI